MTGHTRAPCETPLMGIPVSPGAAGVTTVVAEVVSPASRLCTSVMEVVAEVVPAAGLGTPATAHTGDVMVVEEAVLAAGLVALTPFVALPGWGDCIEMEGVSLAACATASAVRRFCDATLSAASVIAAASLAEDSSTLASRSVA